MDWWEETAHVLVALHPLEKQKRFEAAIPDAVQQLAGRRTSEACRKGWQTRFNKR
jgi:hypothetical protein